MKAIVYEKYGAPDVLELKEVEKPVPKDNQVLVKIHAASVNPLDWHFMRGSPRMARLAFGLTKPKIKILGADLAGTVEAVGAKVKDFQPGDEVFGNPKGLGALAEYACVPENGIVLKPANASFEEAASIPVAAITALQGLRDYGKIQPGQRVLINGAAGGVGTFSVQIAKSFGAVVTGVCGTANLEMVKSIGADFVIDYTKEDFTKRDDRFDLILDNVGNRSVSDYRRILNAGGKCVIVGYTSPGLLLQHMFWGPVTSWVGEKVTSMGNAKPNRNDLMFLKELVESGKVKPVIDRRYPLSETAEAIRYLETGHARGKVVITM